MKKGKTEFVTAIILAAGSGSRMGRNITKQKIDICGESVLRRSVKAFAESSCITSIVVVVKDDELTWAQEELCDLAKIKNIISGGKTRAESAMKGFSVIDARSEFVAIHDGARCLVTEKIITDVVCAAFKHGAATASCAVSDTLKVVKSDGFIERTIPREGVFYAQTPQVFPCDLYRKAIEKIDEDTVFTDDNMLIESLGEKIHAVDTGKENIKITTSADLDYAKYLIERRSEMGEFRVGHGYDVHRLTEGRKLILGGVEIPHSLGLLGHSDADVLIHAVMDALLGACALGDIGRHFPDTSGEFKDISSLLLLDRVCDLVKENGYSIVNIDVTLVMQRPKIASYIEAMIDNLAKIAKIKQSRINIKATTEEKLGFTGSEEGVSCHAVATVKNKG